MTVRRTGPARPAVRREVCHYWAMTDTSDDEQAAKVAAVLRQELRAAGRAARESGTDPEEITSDLTERLARLRRLNAADRDRDAD